MKPIVKYRGGKSKEIPFFEQYIPRDYHTYYEPFLGGGAVYFTLEPEHAVVNDINDKLISFYRDLRDNFDRFVAECNKVSQEYTINRAAFDRLKEQYPTTHVEDANEALYYKIRDMFNGKIQSEYCYSLLYYFINKTSYSGMIRYNASGDFNVPFGRYKSFNGDVVTQEHCDLLKRTQLFNTDYEEIFGMATENDFMFLDPPYDCIFNDYGNEGGFNEEEHRRLAANFNNLNCRCLMVIGETPLTEELYRNHIIDRYDKRYSVNIRNRFQSAATHIVVTNY